MAEKDNFSDYRLKHEKAVKAELGIAKELDKAYRSIGKQLKEQLQTQDSIDKAINSMFGFENQMVGLQEKKKALGKDASQEEQKQLETQIQSVQASRDMAASLTGSLGGLKSMVKGAKALKLAFMANPILAIATVLIAAAVAMAGFAKEVLETRKNLGVSLTTAAKVTAQTKLLGIAGKAYGLEVSDINEAQTAIRQNLGASVQESVKLSLSFARTSAATGQSADDLAKTLSIMESMSGASREVLLNQIRSNAAMIEAAGVAPALVMKDIAANAEFFASFAKDGGKNLIMAGTAARKLGLDMSAVASITESLLDFESSIEASMEASMLLGRNINTDKARQLALAGDQEGLMKEVRRLAGGEAEFNEMNVVQRQSLAKAVGTSVEQLSRLVRNNTATATPATAATSDDSVFNAVASGNEIAMEQLNQTKGLRKDLG